MGLPCPKALCQAIRLFARCEPGFAGREERTKRLLRPTNALTGFRAGMPLRRPGPYRMAQKVVSIMRKLPRRAARAGRYRAEHAGEHLLRKARPQRT
jgi:hypothetical protein